MIRWILCQSCLVQRRWVCAHRRRCCQWCLVRTCLTTGLQALSLGLSQPIADSLSTDRGIVRSWCNSGSCCCHPVPVPHVWCSDVPILCRCCYTWSATARMISCPSCLPVARLRRLTVRTSQFIALATSAVLIPPCSMPKACSHIFLLVLFRVSRKACLVSWIFITDLNCPPSVSC